MPFFIYLNAGQPPDPQAGAGEQGAALQAVSAVPEVIAWAEMSFCSSVLPHCLQLTLSELLRTSVSKRSPHSLQLNS